jgi:hypothetical protein
MKKQIFLLGAVLTVVTGCITVFFINTTLWAPGFYIAFLVGGGSHEGYLGAALFWSIAVVVNFLVYSGLSWVLMVTIELIREENRQANS